MKTRNLLRRWRRRTRQLLEQSLALHGACRAQGTARQIHDLRVVARRLKVLARLARPILHPKTRAELDHWAARISQATNDTRDLDVAIEGLEPGRASDSIRRCLSRLREQTWELRQESLGLFPRVLRSELRLTKSGKPAARCLAKRLKKLEAKLRSFTLEEIGQFATMTPERRHDFRRQIRRWRYLVEFRLKRSEQSADPLLAALLKAQEAIGNEQNRFITEASVQELPKTTDAKATGETVRRLRQRRAANTRAISRALRELAKTVAD